MSSDTTITVYRCRVCGGLHATSECMKTTVVPKCKDCGKMIPMYGDCKCKLDSEVVDES